MRRTIKSALAVLALSLSTASHAQSSVYPLQPTGVGVFADGTAFILLGGSGVSAGCTGTAQVRFMTTTSGGSEMYKTALSAFMAGRPLKAHLSGCLNNYPLATYIFAE
jgi:hypothetical protein